MPDKSLPALHLRHRGSYSCENIGEGSEQREAEKSEPEEPWQRASAVSREPGPCLGIFSQVGRQWLLQRAGGCVHTLVQAFCVFRTL